MTPVFQLSQLPAGHMHQVTVGDYDVLLANVDGQVYAVENKCSHYGFALHKGALCEHQVRCPLHHACFDLRTGEQMEAPGLDGLRRFAVEVEGDEIRVGEEPIGDEVHGDDTTGAPQDAARRTTYDYAIVGAGVAAAYAVDAIRETDREGSILLLGKEELPPYDRTKVSKALMQGGAEVEGLPLRSKAYFGQRGVTFLSGTTVERVNLEDREIKTNHGSFSYGKVLLASGSTPRTLDIPGSDLENVYQVRDVHDGTATRDKVGEGTKVVVIGASFIGLEAAMSLGKQGGDIHVVGREEVLFKGPFGEKVGNYVQQLHEEAGVTFHLGTSPEAIESERGRVSGVRLDNGTTLAADLVIVGIGVTPNTDYLYGLATNQDGSITVDNHLAADVADTFVAGDIARYPGRTGEERIEHWKVAGQQGRIAGRNMAGNRQPYVMIPFFWSNQQGINFRYTGHAKDYDEIVFDGEPGQSPFLAFYLKNGQVQACLGVKRDAENAAIGCLLQQRAMPEGELPGRDWLALAREV